MHVLIDGQESCYGGGWVFLPVFRGHYYFYIQKLEVTGRERPTLRRTMGRHSIATRDGKAYYYACDMTGLPMKDANCFVPLWKDGASRMTKRGHYCCWEAALMHARQTLEGEALKLAEAYIHEETHHMMRALPVCVTGERGLSHFCAGGDSAATFLKRLWRPTVELECVLIDLNGMISGRTIPIYDGEYAFECQLQHPNGHASWGTNEVVRTYGEVDGMLIEAITPKTGPINTRASDLMGATLHGDVLLARYVEEKALQQRFRYVPLGALAAPLTYQQQLKTMEQQLSSFEAHASSGSEVPQGSAAKLPPPCGKALARMQRAEELVAALPSERRAALEARLVASMPPGVALKA